MKRRAQDGSVTVSGPGYDRAGLPNVSVGISAAQTAASRAGVDGTWYVRGDGPTVAVERRGDLVLVTLRAEVPIAELVTVPDA
jgi:hypothetical protein